MEQVVVYFLCAVVIFFAGTCFGIWRTVSRLVDMAEQHAEEEQQALSPCRLSIEKIGNKFYAYADSEFISQGTEFKPLVLGILNHAYKRSVKFTNTDVSTLSESEVAALLQIVMSMNAQELVQ